MTLIDKTVYELDREQTEILREASARDIKGLVWFSNFAIPMTQISSLELISREYE